MDGTNQKIVVIQIARTDEDDLPKLSRGLHTTAHIYSGARMPSTVAIAAIRALTDSVAWCDGDDRTYVSQLDKIEHRLDEYMSTLGFYPVKSDLYIDAEYAWKEAPAPDGTPD